MKLLDLKPQQEIIGDQIKRRIDQVLEHGRFIMGPEVQELEEKLNDYTGRKHSIGVSSGSCAIMLALLALELEPGSEVITTPFSFIATAEMPHLLGFKLVFADIDPDTYNIDPKKVKEKITAKTKAIIPVDLYGQCADHPALREIASNYGIDIISDAAQSFGADINGTASCKLGRISTTSFFPAKPLGCFGDGGAVFTDDDKLAEKIKQLRVHGQAKRYYHTQAGINGRLDTIQAAVLIEKLKIFDDEIEKRNQIAEFYNESLSSIVKVPFIKSGYRSAYAQYTIRTDKRDQLRDFLSSRDIPTSIHYPRPLHLQPIFESLRTVDSLNIAEKASLEVLSLPMHPYLLKEDQELLVNTIKEFFIGRKKNAS